MLKTILATALAASLLIGCGDRGAKEVTATRTVQAPAPEKAASKNPHEGMNMQGMGMQGMGNDALPPGHPPMAAPFKWAVPEGWEEAAPTSMRIANLKIKSNPKVECYLSVFPGAAGGLVANVNRWRTQVGLPELSEADIKQMPEITVLGRPSKLAEASGSYTSMSGDAQAGYMIMGTVTELGDQSMFVKMVGPEDAVKAEKEHFIAFCKSVQEAAPAAPAPPSAPAPIAAAPGATAAPVSAPAAPSPVASTAPKEGS